MALLISTTNTTGLTLEAILDRVDTDGVLASPNERWDYVAEDWDLPGNITAGNELIPLTESVTGFYSNSISGIDGAAENVRIIIMYSNAAIGVLYNIPLPLVNPEVTVDLTVEEDRS